MELALTAPSDYQTQMTKPRPQPDMARYDFALSIVRQLRDAGFQSLLAGGCVRDQILGKEPKDYDVATDATPTQVIHLFGERRTVAIGASFGVVMIPGTNRRQGQVEVATFRRDGEYLDGRHPQSVRFCSAREDAQRRDFTINGMFFDPISDTVIDHVGGLEDLKREIVRAIGDPVARFSEDKLRMLRAVRFAATFQFHLDESTELAIRTLNHQITQVSVERILQELKRMLAHSSRHKALAMLHSTGLLQQILPELFHANGPVPADTQFLLTALQNLESVHFEPAMAILLGSLHISGKPDASARLSAVRETCRRLKMANDEMETICWILESGKLLDDLACKPLHVRKPLLAHRYSSQLLSVSSAMAAARGLPADDAAFAWHYLSTHTPESLAPEPLINGSDVMALGIPEGPVIKNLLATVRNAQLDEQVSDRDSAIRLLQSLVSQ